MASMHLTHALQFLCLSPGVLSYVFYGLCVVLYVTVLCPHKSIHPLKETVASRFTALPQNEGNLEIVHGLLSI